MFGHLWWSALCHKVGVRKVPGMSEHMGLVDFGVKNSVISVGCFGETS